MMLGEGNGFRGPYRSITLVMLGVMLLVAVLTLYMVRSIELALASTVSENSRIAAAVDKLSTALEIQTYLLSLSQAERPRLDMPAALWNRLQKGEDFTGDPGQRRRFDRDERRLPRLTPPGDGG